MQVSRRDFICSVAGASAVALGVDVQPLIAQARTLKSSKTTETRSNLARHLRLAVRADSFSNGSRRASKRRIGPGFRVIDSGPMKHVYS